MISCLVNGVVVETWESDEALAKEVKEHGEDIFNNIGKSWYNPELNSFSKMLYNMSKEDKPTWINESNTIKE